MTNLVLVPGADPLTESQVEDINAAFSWILDVTLPPVVAALLRAEVIDEWKRSGPAVRTNLQPLLDAYRNAQTGTKTQRILVREENQSVLVAALSVRSDRLSRAFMALYGNANAPIAQGTWPLTYEAAVATVQMDEFLTALHDEQPWTPLEPQAETDYVARLAQIYPTLSTTAQSVMFGSPLAWARLRALWESTPEPDRADLARQLLRGDKGPEKVQQDAGRIVGQHFVNKDLMSNMIKISGH